MNKKNIINYLEKNPGQVDWDYRDSLSKDQIEKILENGLLDFENELYEMNMDYICDIENQIIEDAIEKFDLNIDTYDFRELFLEHIRVDLNIKALLNNTSDITCLIKVFSNYDCTNSFDTMDDDGYMPMVWQRVKSGVKKSDYIWEHQNGAYGGCLFCFVFKTPLENLIKLKENFKKTITIPKGTQFGFFSDFQGAGSVFEKRTYRNMILPKFEPGQTEYDYIGIMADCQNGYTMQQVYGGIDFIDEQNITVS